MNNTNESILAFLGQAAKSQSLVFDFKTQYAQEDNLSRTPLLIDFEKIIRNPETRSIIINIIKNEEKFIEGADIIIGMGSVGSAIATIVAEIFSKKLINDIKIPQNATVGKCIVFKDQLINGKKTIGFIDDLQNAGFDCLGIFVIFNENLKITEERFEGITGVKESGDTIKLKKPCSIHNILTPQKIYNALISSDEPFTQMIGQQYKLMHEFEAKEEANAVQSSACE